MNHLRYFLYPAAILLLIGITLAGCFGCSSSSSGDGDKSDNNSSSDGSSQAKDPILPVGVNVLSMKDISAEFRIAVHCEDVDEEYFGGIRKM